MSERTALCIVDSESDASTRPKIEAEYCTRRGCPQDSHRVSNCCDLLAAYTVCGRWKELAEQNPNVEDLRVGLTSSADRDQAVAVLLREWRQTLQQLSMESVADTGLAVPRSGLPALRELTCDSLDAGTALVLFKESVNLRSIRCRRVARQSIDWTTVPPGVLLLCPSYCSLTDELDERPVPNLNAILSACRSLTVCGSEERSDQPHCGFDDWRRAARDGKLSDFRLETIGNYDVQDMVAHTKESLEHVRIGNAAMTDVGLEEMRSAKKLKVLVVSMQRSSGKHISLTGIMKFVRHAFADTNQTMMRFEVYDRFLIPDSEQKLLVQTESELSIAVFSLHHLCGTWSMMTSSHGDVQVDGLMFRRVDSLAQDERPILPRITSSPVSPVSPTPHHPSCPIVRKKSPSSQKFHDPDADLYDEIQPPAKAGCRGICDPEPAEKQKEEAPPVPLTSRPNHRPHADTPADAADQSKPETVSESPSPYSEVESDSPGSESQPPEPTASEKKAAKDPERSAPADQEEEDAPPVPVTPRPHHRPHNVSRPADVGSAAGPSHESQPQTHVENPEYFATPESSSPNDGNQVVECRTEPASDEEPANVPPHAYENIRPASKQMPDSSHPKPKPDPPARHGHGHAAEGHDRAPPSNRPLPPVPDSPPESETSEAPAYANESVSGLNPNASEAVPIRPPRPGRPLPAVPPEESVPSLDEEQYLQPKHDYSQVPDQSAGCASRSAPPVRHTSDIVVVPHARPRDPDTSSPSSEDSSPHITPHEAESYQPPATSSPDSESASDAPPVSEPAESSAPDDDDTSPKDEGRHPDGHPHRHVHDDMCAPATFRSKEEPAASPSPSEQSDGAPAEPTDRAPSAQSVPSASLSIHVVKDPRDIPQSHNQKAPVSPSDQISQSPTGSSDSPMRVTVNSPVTNFVSFPQLHDPFGPEPGPASDGAAPLVIVPASQRLAPDDESGAGPGRPVTSVSSLERAGRRLRELMHLLPRCLCHCKCHKHQ